MLDEELQPAEREAVWKHLNECESCAQYYEDIAKICDAARVPDMEPPEGFSARWKRAIERENAPEQTRSARWHKTGRSGWRLSRVMPILACSILGVFLVSTALLNPQAFGLGGESLRSEQGTVTPSAQAMAAATDDAVSPIVFGNVVLPSKAPKLPATQNEEYWEETVWSQATPSQVVTGDIEQLPEDGEDMRESADGADVPREEEVFELITPGEATIAAMRSYAQDAAGITATEADDGVLVEGPADDIALLLVAFGFDGPEGITRVHIACETAD